MPPSLQLKKAHTINGYPALPFIYNRWPEWSRMGGRNGVEYAFSVHYGYSNESQLFISIGVALICFGLLRKY